MDHALSLVILEDTLAVCHLPPGSTVPAPGREDSLYALVHTAEEVSLVCRRELVPIGAEVEYDWRAIKVQGPLDFSMIGVLVSLALPLSQQGVSIFAISTYETDYLLVKESRLSAAVEALRTAGHTVEFTSP